ncbi:hypothetical protein AAC387_Pa03g2052 [Persea americana]
MGTDLIYRGHDSQNPAHAYTPKPPKPWLSSVSRAARYLLREQRLIFVLVGIAVASLLFIIVPRTSAKSHISNIHTAIAEAPGRIPSRTFQPHHVPSFGSPILNPTGKIPLGLKRKGLRIVVTGGAGFVGSHLVDRLIARGDSVIVVDNFFTGRKENLIHHFGNPRFELIRHDVVEPILLEVDQIYHLACPASPVHYKFNPVKTIISFSMKSIKNFPDILFSLFFRDFQFLGFSFLLSLCLNVLSLIRWLAGAQDECGWDIEHVGPG